MIVRLKSFFLHAAFLGVLFGFLGWFLVNYGFIHPADSSISNDLTIEATGQKDNKSKSSEVWFYGAYLVSALKSAS